MHYCRHCQKPTLSSTGPCPHCGEQLSETAEELAANLASLDIDDMGERRVDPATGEVMLGGSSSSHEVDLDTGGSTPIELGFDPHAERARPGPTKRAIAPEGNGPAEESGSPARPAASAASPASQVHDVDEVASISGYGPEPTGFLQAVPYMLHVRKRREILKNEISKIDAEHEAAREDLDKDLLLVGNRKLDELEVDPGAYERELEAINKGRRLVESFRSERAIEEQDMKGKESYVDEEITRLQVEADKFKSEQDVLNSDAEDAYASRKRIQLRLQRVEIEIRNIREQIPRPKKGEPPPDPAIVMPLESKIAGLEEVKGHIKSEIATADDGIKEINRKLGIARNQVSEQMGKITLTNKKKTDLLQSRKASDEVSQSKFYELQGTLEDDVRSLARKVLRGDALPANCVDMKSALELKISGVEAIESKLQLYRTAIDSYSSTDFKRGNLLLLGTGVLAFILLLLILAIIF